MTPPPTGDRPSPEEFRVQACEAFAFLGAMGFREEPVPSEHNPVAVWFASDVTRVVVEGVNWGLNARVALGRAGASAKFENFDLLDLVAVRGAPPLAAAGQAAQLPQLAAALRQHGRDVLAGDFAVFAQLKARVDARAAEFRARPRVP